MTSTARLIITSASTKAQREAVFAMLEGAIVALGSQEYSAGRLARADVSAFVDAQRAELTRALAGKPVPATTAGMVRAAVVLAGCTAEVCAA